MDNVTNPLNLVQGVNNNLVEGHLFTVLLFLIAIIGLIAMKNYDLKAGSIAVFFGTTIIGALLWAADLLAYYIVGFSAILLFASIIIKMIWND